MPKHLSVFFALEGLVTARDVLEAVISAAQLMEVS